MFNLEAMFDPDRPSRRPAPTPSELDPDPAPAELPADWHLLWDERAAIMEYDGGLSREKAEAEALKDILAQMRR